MKRTATLAVGLALAGAAQAQSTVTIFGRLDLAARYVDNEDVGKNKSLANTGNSSSRFGLRGVEDLGGGLSAGFHLESSVGVNVGTGGASNSAAPNQFWDRHSYLYLNSKTLGQLRLGYDLTQLYNIWGDADPFSHVGVGGSGNLYQASQTGPIRAAFGSDRNLSTTVRSRNMVRYDLPDSFGGLSASVFAAPRSGGTVAGNAANKYIGASAGYASGPVSLGIGHATTQNDLTGNDKFKETVVRGLYSFPAVRVGAAWRKFEFRTSSQELILLSVQAPVGPGTLKATVQRSDMSGNVGATNIDANGATQWALGYVYDLSRRTALYTTLARVDNKGTSTNVAPGGLSVTAATFGGKTSTGFDLGLRHIF